MWGVYLRSHAAEGKFPQFPADDATAWNILKEAESAEGGFETVLIKLASEYASDGRDRILLASFRLDFLTYAAGLSQARRMALISAGVSWSA